MIPFLKSVYNFKLKGIFRKILGHLRASKIGIKNSWNNRTDGTNFHHIDKVNPTSSDDDERIFQISGKFPKVNLTSSDDHEETF
jgi:hypothetical protein